MITIFRAALLAVLGPLAAGALGATPVEGRDYFRVDPAQPTSDPAKILVTEYFSYHCPHCYAFARPYAKWSAGLPSDVKADRAAVSIGHAGWVASAQAYYAFTAMKATPGIDDALFAAIHRQRAKLSDQASFAEWVAGQGIDRAKFENLYRSFSVQMSTKRADDQSRKLRIPSVPSLVIDGKYLIPIADDGQFTDQLELANALVERVRSERAAAGKSIP